eukprot:4204230-Prymnesium_polylepis.1
MESLVASVLDQLALAGEGKEKTIVEALKRELRLSSPRAMLPLPARSAASGGDSPAPTTPIPSLVLEAGGPPLRERPSTDLRVALRSPAAERHASAAATLPPPLPELDGALLDGPVWPGPPRELRSAALTQCGDRVDFIAPADNMKTFFKLLQHAGRHLARRASSGRLARARGAGGGAVGAQQRRASGRLRRS